MASFLRRPSNTAANNPKKNIVRFGSSEPPPMAPKPTKKGSFVSLLGGIVGGSGGGQQQYYFDNGVDPLGRLSVDSAPPPPPSPVQQRPTVNVALHWIEQLCPLAKPAEAYASPPADLVARVRHFLSQHEPSAMDKATHMAVFGQQEGEAALNAKLFHRFGEGLPLRVPGHKAGKQDGPVPKTLREIIRAYLKEHDPGYLAIEGESGLDEMLAQAAEYGIESVEAELCRKYGVGLNGKKCNNNDVIFMSESSVGSSQGWSREQSFDMMAQAAAPMESSSPSPLSPIIQKVKPPVNLGKTTSPPGLEKVKSENKPQTFFEVSVADDEDNNNHGSVVPMTSPISMPDSSNNPGKTKKHDFFDDRVLRADLKAFYTKHDPKKLDLQKFEPIVQWAYKIGPGELNRRFEEKYGETLTQFIEDRQAGRPGVSPGPKIVPKEDNTPGETISANACRDYHEAKSGKGFGVCECGFSRVDHRGITSLLVPGPNEPQFNRAKPKVVISKNAPPPASAASKPAPASNNNNSNNNKPWQQAPKAQPQSPKAQPQSPTAMKAPPPGLSVQAKVNKVIPQQPKFELKEEGRDGPCGEYRLDLEGRSFGVCKCGWSRFEHHKTKQQVAWAQ